MNKEITRLKEQLELLVKDDETYQETIIRQSNIINKAIEYIENHTYDKNGECGYTPDWEVKELYDILKGSDTNVKD